MKKCTGKTFPNGKSKLTLFESYLSCRDFGCQPEDYLLDLELLRKESNEDIEGCHWCIDNDGRHFVDAIKLADSGKQILITENSFEIVNIVHNVFISYAKEDKEHAHRLRDVLRARGASPWLDEDNLLPGQHWEIEIEEQIFNCNYFIALLSTKSVSKRGYVQREIRLALEVLQRMPEKEIFLIPARIDECAPTHSALNGIHRVDLYPNWQDGVDMIFRAMKI